MKTARLSDDTHSGELVRRWGRTAWLAPVHTLDGLPCELVLSHNPGGRGAIVKASVVSGFIREGLFYSRDEAAAHAATVLETESAF